MARSKSSRRWLHEHFSDNYVQNAHKKGYRSRAVFKLQELDQRDRLLKPGMTVVDLGAAPGGWSQLAAEIVGAKGFIIASDILPMDPLPGVNILQGDFRETEVLDKLVEMLAGREVGLVMSDMAPNISGIDAVDQPRSMYLAELATDMALKVLAPGGDFLVKIFQGSGFDELKGTLKQRFGKIIVRKPKASRPRSREVYLLAKGYTNK